MLDCLAYSPCSRWVLSGKYRNGQMPKGTRIEPDGDFWSRHLKPIACKAY